MKKNKNLLYNNQILNCLLNEKTYTTLEIASKVGLSEKTIRVRLNEINEWMEQNEFGKIQKDRDQEYGWSAAKGKKEA